MVRKITLRQVGGSIGATLPKDMADRLHVKSGDEVFAIETEQGILLTPYDPTFEGAPGAPAVVRRRVEIARLRAPVTRSCDSPGGGCDPSFIRAALPMPNHMPDPASLLPLSEAAFEILMSVADRSRHGNAIMQEVEDRTGGRIRLG